MAPRIESPESGEYDATIDHNLQFIIEELFPQTITISVNEEMVVNEQNWDGSLNIASVVIAGLPGESEIVRIIVGDQHGNTNENTLSIFWEDLTDPFVFSPEDMEFKKQNAIGELKWNWQEKFQTKVELLIDGVSQIEINNAVDQSITVSIDYLNSLSSGRHDFNLIIEDQGENTIQDDVIVFVTTDNNNTNDSPVNTLFPVLPLFITVVILRQRKK